MHEIAEAAQPITGRGVGYKLFTAGLIPSMSANGHGRVYRLLKQAREKEISLGVDCRRDPRARAAWRHGATRQSIVRAVSRSYRRDFWQQQPDRVDGCQREGHGARRARPVLDEYGVGFLPCTASAAPPPSMTSPRTTTAAKLIVLYVGDYDPSGMYMSEEDLPDRLEKYGG